MGGEGGWIARAQTLSVIGTFWGQIECSILIDTAGKFGTKVCNRMFEEGYVTFQLRYRSLDDWSQIRYDVWTADTTSVTKL